MSDAPNNELPQAHPTVMNPPVSAALGTEARNHMDHEKNGPGCHGNGVAPRGGAEAGPAEAPSLLNLNPPTYWIKRHELNHAIAGQPCRCVMPCTLAVPAADFENLKAHHATLVWLLRESLCHIDSNRSIPGDTDRAKFKADVRAELAKVPAA